jgi:hypothetical protein
MYDNNMHGERIRIAKTLFVEASVTPSYIVLQLSPENAVHSQTR